MQLTMLKGKLHQARVTHAELNYDGSCAIDRDLLEAVGILPFEQVDVYNIENGERFHTYAIVAEPGSGVISLNGAAARKAVVGDRLIICSYVTMDAAAAARHKPTLVYLDSANTIQKVSQGIAVQPGC